MQTLYPGRDEDRLLRPKFIRKPGLLPRYTVDLAEQRHNTIEINRKELLPEGEFNLDQFSEAFK